jgi:predicted peptidase
MRALAVLALVVTLDAKAITVPGRLLAFNEHGEDPATLPYQLFVPHTPVHASPSSLKPLIVFLHGAGDGPFEEMNAQSLPGLLLRNASFAASFPFLALFPCSTCHTPGVRAGWHEDSFARVDRLISQLMTSHAADPSRIILTGQSMGGGGLWRYAAARPALFAALVPVCAAMRPSEDVAARICCSDGPEAGCCPPVWAFHGANDGSVPVSATDGMVEMLRALKRGQSVEYTRYEYAPPPPMPEYASMVGHGSYELAYREDRLYAWMLEAKCAACKGPPKHFGVETETGAE